MYNISFIKYLDKNFFSTFPDNIIIVGGGIYDITLENKIKQFDCVIRIHNYRAYQQHLEAEKINIQTKTDYIYTWVGRALEFNFEGKSKQQSNDLKEEITEQQLLEYDQELNKIIPTLKGIIFYADPYSQCNLGCDRLSSRDKEFFKKLYKNETIKDNHIKYKNRLNHFYIEYIDQDAEIYPTNPNPILEQLNIDNRVYPKYGLTSGMRIILQCINANKNVSIVGFSTDQEICLQYDLSKKDQDMKELNECQGRCCSAHSGLCESKIINELVKTDRLKIIK